MNKEDLYVIAVISNPAKFKSRYRLYKQFKKHMLDSGANFYTVELAIGKEEFRVTSKKNPKHIQLRTNDELWHKENLINIAISKLPHDWKYVAWIDADIEFERQDWIEGTLQKLQEFPVVQLFEEGHDLGPNGDVILKNTGLAYCYQKSKKIGQTYGEHWHPGYAWAATREFIEHVGGLVDETLVGAADHQMAMAMIGRAEEGVHGSSHENLKRLVLEWGKKASEFLKGRLGYLEGNVRHFWHGPKAARKYVERWSIVVENSFDPAVDLHRLENGLLEFASDKPKLKEDLKAYFRQRDEDSNKT